VSLTENREDDIYTINPDGSGKFRVTNTKNTDEEWLDYSPDGKKIAYTDYRQGPGTAIYTISVRGGGKSKVAGGADPSYSPDGKRIAYEGWIWDRNRNYVVGFEIYTIKVTGGKPLQLTHNKMEDWGPFYSPDGKKITYAARADRKDDYEIYTINAGGGGRVQVTHNRTDNIDPSWGSRP
jgi:TolB protein